MRHRPKVLHSVQSLLAHKGGNCKLKRKSHGSLNSGWGGSEDVRDDMANDVAPSDLSNRSRTKFLGWILVQVLRTVVSMHLLSR